MYQLPAYAASKILCLYSRNLKSSSLNKNNCTNKNNTILLSLSMCTETLAIYPIHLIFKITLQGINIILFLQFFKDFIFRAVLDSQKN